MNKLFIIIMISFLGITSFAQERFYQLYDGWCINKVFEYDDIYLANGLAINSVENKNIIQFNYIETNGNLLDSPTYENDTIDGISVYRSNSYYLNEDTLWFIGSIVVQNKNYILSPFLIKYDLANNIVDTLITYNDCTNSDGMNLLLDTISLGFLISGNYRYVGDNYFPMLIFTDSTGDTLSTKAYDFLPTNSIRRMVIPYQLLKLPDGGFLLSCQDEIGYYNYHGEIQRTCFLRLDNNGDELWRKYTTNQDTITFHSFAALMPDGDYLIAWSDPWLVESTNPNKTIWLARMTDEGVIYGKKKVSDDINGFESKSYLINDCYQDENGNVFLAGEAQLIPFTSFLLKIDTLGIVKWHREYECFPENDAIFSYSRINGITPTSDGGFIMGGEYVSDPGSMFPAGTQQGLVIKVDSMGCLYEGCDYTNVKHTINTIKAEIFPNPAIDKITITLPEQTSNAKLKIYDAKGCLWMDFELNINEETIDVSTLPVGQYTINIWANGKLFTGKFVKK